ncbi:MAG: hypothetical protein AB8B81_05520 [Halioglobus sp.]
MHELTRRAYLDAMGIETYVSRAQIPGSAVTLKLAVVKSLNTPSMPSIIDKPTDAPAPARPRAAAQMPSLDFEPQLRSESASSDKTPPVSSGSAAAVEFGIAAFLTEGWLWLEELPLQQALMRDQVQLVQAMASALGCGSEKPEVAQFNWPIYTNDQLDTGVEAARGALGGFINRKMEQSSARGIVLLGSACQQWVALDQLSTEHQILTLSTSQMLHQPALKKGVWQDLLPYRV